jgi:hypothetical protein
MSSLTVSSIRLNQLFSIKYWPLSGVNSGLFIIDWIVSK